MNQLNILSNIPLKDHCTMQTGGAAAQYVEVHTEKDLLEVVRHAKAQKIAIWIVGRGSNTVFTASGFDGTVIKYLADDIVLKNDQLTVAAGREWDEAVAYACEQRMSGIELLSLIPGHCGAAPVQNIGAYGQQLSDVLTSVRVLDIESEEFYDMPAAECDLGYRESRFKRTAKKNFIITSITMQLSADQLTAGILYKDIEAYLVENQTPTERSPQMLRKATIAVRQKKLPDPNITPNSGSFFKNPIVSADLHAEIIQKYPELNPWTSKIFGTTSQGFWPLPDGTVKIAAGMLMEHSGFADYHDDETGLETWPTQALCVTNPNGSNAADLELFVEKIQNTMQERYNIPLEIEPELI